MKFFAQLTTLLCVILSLKSVCDGQPCEDSKDEINEKIREMMKNGGIPKCFEQYKLDQFMEDEGEKRFEQFLESKKTEEAVEILTCGIESMDKVFEEVEIDEECRKAFEEDKKKLETLRKGQ